MSKIALITGAASGMGLATSRALAAKGWTIAVVDLNAESGEKAAHELKGKFYKTNVNDYDSLAHTFAQVWKDHGRLDFVWANAGIVEKVDFYRKHDSDADNLPPRLDTVVLDINLKAVVTTCYLAVHFFRRNQTPGGCLCITASSGGIYPAPYLPMYAAAKHGCVGFMRSIEETLWKEGIRANALCPGAVRTGLISQAEWDRFPQESFVPIEKVVSAVQMLIDDSSLHGKAVELMQDKWKFRDAPVFEDEAMKSVMTMDGTPFEREK